MAYKCTNCAHEQEEYQRFCPTCGDFIGKEGLESKKKAEPAQESAPEEKEESAPESEESTVGKVKEESKEEKKEEELNLDLNNDGVVDKKDASIAGKALRRISKKLKSKND